MTDKPKPAERLASQIAGMQRGIEAAIAVPRISPMPPFRNPLVDNVQENWASAFHQRLVKWISDFDASLDSAHEVGVRLVGQAVVFHLGAMSYWNPSLIVFRGVTDEGNPVELIQHVSQISVLLVKLPRANPEEAKRPIGFDLPPGAAEPA